jgi:iron complex outermembrane receptor protein
MKVLTGLLVALLIPFGAASQSIDSKHLALDALMDLDVQLSTVTRRLRVAKENAASIYVLPGDEIKRSGVTSIPQALSLVPGLQVRKIDNNNWAVTLRAVAGRFSSRMLVLVNGQSIYDAVDGGVNWESLNTPLYDIERIEVVRSNGGLSWGNNATNGVVNIITKHSEDTRGLLSTLEVGSELTNAAIRFGKDLDSLGSFRVHAFSKNLRESNNAHFSITPNDSNHSQGIGTRFDLNLSDSVFVLVQGEYQNIDIRNVVLAPDLLTNATQFNEDSETRDLFNFAVRLDHIIDNNTSQVFQLTYNNEEYDSFYFEDKQEDVSIDYLISSQINAFQFDFGLNYRNIGLTLTNNDYLTSLNNLDSLQYYSAFLQAQYEHIPSQVSVSLGSKVERNSATGWQHQPSAKVMWKVNEESTLWGSISKGSRFPSFTEMDLSFRAAGIPFGNFILAQIIQGNKDIQAEQSVSKEVGYRYSASRWDIDLSLFKTEADNVLTTDVAINPPSLFIQTFVSDGRLDTYGAEAFVDWQVASWVNTELTYSFAKIDYDLSENLQSPTGENSKVEQWLFKTSLQLSDAHSLFTTARWERGDAYSTDDYYALDVSWQWQISENLQFSATGNNLFISDRVEYANTRQLFVVPSLIEPSYVINLSYFFE